MVKNILVIGSANTDMITHVKSIPRPGETVLGGTFMTAQGGKGANQAVAASRAGGQVTFITCLGNDVYAEQSLRSYMADNINVSQVIRDENTPSGVALIFVSENGENSIAVASGANARLLPERIDCKKQTITNADILLMQLEIPLVTVERVFDLVDTKKTTIILNPAPACELPNGVLQELSFITPNETEAEQMTGVAIIDESSAQQAARMLLDKGVNNVILTLGSQGALVANSQLMEIVPSQKVNVIDTTAAGDTFNGALAVALAENKSVSDAVRFANAAASLSVTRYGAQPSIPTRVAIDLLTG